MNPTRPYSWEASYPPGVDWGTPIAVTTLPGLLACAVAKYGPRPALEYRDHQISYEQLGRKVDALAAALIADGLAKGDRVALLLPNTPHHPIAFFAVMKAGGIVVHLSPLDAERELMHKLADSGARRIVTTSAAGLWQRTRSLTAAGLVDQVLVGDDATFGSQPGSVPATPPLGAEGVNSLERFAAPHETEPPPAWPALSPDDTALLQYTGGTTGLPKAAILTHANLTAAVAIHNVWAEPQGLYPESGGRIICVLPLFHMYAVTACLTRGLDRGQEILLRPRFDVQQTMHDIEVKRATAFPGVPTMWIAIASLPDIEQRDFSSLRTMASGGAPLPVEIEQRLQRLTRKRMVGGWGMTETSPAGSNIPPHRPDKRGTIGLPLPGIVMDIVALDDARRVLGPGETGEIRIKGPNVTKGYWKKPEETAAAFADGYLLTGDIGHMDEEGFFYLTDRKKDMIISGGFNVYPRVIEEAIWEHPDVAEVIVIGIDDAYRGQAAKAFVTLKPGCPPFSLDDLRAFLADKIGRHELPAALEFRDALPRTSVGKLSKKELVAEERARSTALS